MGYRSSPNTNSCFPVSSNGRPTSSPNNQPSPRPCLGYFQICGIQGHTTKRCPSFSLVTIEPNTTPNVLANRNLTLWQPRAHFVANTSSNTHQWLLDSGTSHHVTTNPSNLFLSFEFLPSFSL